MHGHSNIKISKLYISLQYPILFLQILFMFKGSRNSTVSIVTYCRLGVLGLKWWWGKDFWIHPDQLWGPTSLLYKKYWVCFLEMKWPGCGADRQPLLVLWSCIQTAIPLFPLCVCLACNRTAITFIHIQIHYIHITTIRWRPLKIYAVAPDCLTWQRYVQHFTLTLYRLSM